MTRADPRFLFIFMSLIEKVCSFCMPGFLSMNFRQLASDRKHSRSGALPSRLAAPRTANALAKRDLALRRCPLLAVPTAWMGLGLKQTANAWLRIRSCSCLASARFLLCRNLVRCLPPSSLASGGRGSLHFCSALSCAVDLVQFRSFSRFFSSPSVSGSPLCSLPSRGADCGGRPACFLLAELGALVS